MRKRNAYKNSRDTRSGGCGETENGYEFPPSVGVEEDSEGEPPGNTFNNAISHSSRAISHHFRKRWHAVLSSIKQDCERIFTQSCADRGIPTVNFLLADFAGT